MKIKTKIVQHKQEIITELLRITGVLILFFIALKIAFYKEAMFMILKLCFGIFYLFFLPGYFILIHWYAKLNFLSRVVAGTIAGYLTIGFLTYVLGLLGINIKYGFFLSTLVISVNILIFLARKED